MTVLERLTNAAQKRAQYTRTYYALSGMSKSVRSDLGLEGADLDEVAYKAVYGR